MSSLPALLFADTRFLLPAPLPRLTAKLMTPVFKDPGALEVDVPAYIAAHQDWILDLSAREPDSHLPVWLQYAARDATLMWIQSRGVTSNLIRFNQVWRNKRGFRRHFLAVDSPGALIVGTCPRAVKYEDGSRSVRFLQNIPKRIRRVGLRAPAGRILIQADIKSAFSVFMAHGAHDVVLHEDLGRNFHQVVADALGISRDRAKIVNNGLIGLMGSERLHKEFGKAGLDTTLKEARQYHRSWWNRYAASKRLKAALRANWKKAVIVTPDDVVHGLQPMMIIAPDGQEVRYSKAEVAGAKLPNEKTVGFPSMVSAIWQCIEATAMDLAMLDLHRDRGRTGLKLVLGMYDGLMYSAPEDHARDGALRVAAAIEEALRRIGYPGNVETVVHRYWWSKP